MPTKPTGSPDAPVSARLTHRLQLTAGRAAQAIAVRLRRPVSLGVRLLAFNSTGQVLLVRHTYLPGLALPGGGVDPGETCAEAALREAHEEANLEVPDPPELFHVYFNRALANRDHVVMFVARNVRQSRPKGRGAEIVSADFYDADTLPEDTTRATRARIAEVLTGRPIDPIW